MGTISNELEQSKKYRLDIIEGIKYKRREISIAKLTTDNVARVEAMIFTDSGYKNSANDSKEIKYKKDSSEVKYVGSTAFWFNQLKELIDKDILVSSKGYGYNCIIEYLVIAIDNENSTHLNSDGMGRKEVTERLTDIKLKDLIQLLKNDNRNYDLIKLIEKPQKPDEKHHFSFATKFCHYACLYLFKDEKYEDNYSIYDSVLKNALPYYIKYYLNQEVDYSIYENDYVKYIKYIDKLRQVAKEMYGTEISRNGFDHLIWYYHKGN